MQAARQKERYYLQDYASSEKVDAIRKDYNAQTKRPTCLCGSLSRMNDLVCFRCSTPVHHCVRPHPNRGNRFQCLSCLILHLDPLYCVKDTLLQTYFRVENIYEYANQITFEFLKPSSRVEVRCMSGERMCHAFPMQGTFYLNQELVLDCKPLRYNSNKKHRKDEYLQLPLDKLKSGRNVLKFKVPKIDPQKYSYVYQSEEKGVYYLSIVAVRVLTKEELVGKTIRENRIELRESLGILTRVGSEEVSVVTDKISLVCPYTRQRIRVPVRGKYCKHFTCVCLETLIITHLKMRGWNCPICDERINEPQVDIWIMDMLKDNSQGVEVVVHKDGQYEWVEKAETQKEEGGRWRGVDEEEQEGRTKKSKFRESKFRESKFRESKFRESCQKQNKQEVCQIIQVDQREEDNDVAVEFKHMQFREVSQEEFGKIYFRGRKSSKKQYSEEIWKIFKEIL